MRPNAPAKSGCRENAQMPAHGKIQQTVEASEWRVAPRRPAPFLLGLIIALVPAAALRKPSHHGRSP